MLEMGKCQQSDEWMIGDDDDVGPRRIIYGKIHSSLYIESASNIRVQTVRLCT